MKRLLVLLAALVAYVGVAFAAVNVNTASKAELEVLNGIGPVKAQAIIDYRTKNGPFKTIDDLKKVDGIGDATLEKIRSGVKLSGASTPPTGAAADKADPAKPAMADAKSQDKKAETKPTDKPGIEPMKTVDEKKADAKAKKEEKKADAKKDDKKADAKKDDKKADAKKDDKKADAKKADAKKDSKKDDDKKKDDEKKK
jgi:competence protein ComEA